MSTLLRALQALGSLKFTLWLFVLFAACVIAYYFGISGGDWLIAVPLLLFAANLLAALAVHPTLNRQPGLLVFHLGLLALLVLAAVSRLTYLKGQVEMTVGERFPGKLTAYEAGPFHHWRLNEVNFQQGDFTIDYDVGINRGATHSQVQWVDADGTVHTGIVGDHHPLVQGGYRFYTSFNKGFAPWFRWYPGNGGAPSLGSVHLPGYPLNQYRQAQEWTLPGTSRRVWVQLQFDEVILDPARPSRFRLPKEHVLVVRSGDIRRELHPGDGVELPEGRLVYQGLGAWMGYQVYSDWTLPWLLASGLVAALGLGWHYWRRFSARPWDAQEE